MPTDGNSANADMWNGTGTDVTVTFYPESANLYGSGEDWDSCPPEVGLGHELIHGIDIAGGDVPGDPTGGPTWPTAPTATRANEEASTIGLKEDPDNGLPDYSNDPDAHGQALLREGSFGSPWGYLPGCIRRPSTGTLVAATESHHDHPSDPHRPLREGRLHTPH